MAYNEKAILRDVNGKPIPQYWNPETQQYEVIEGKDGMLRVIMVDSEGKEIQIQNQIDQIAVKLDELIQVVRDNGV